jgi:hypothetical protein
MEIVPAEFNTIITFLGMTCAMVQACTGFYALHYRKKIALIKTNEILFRSHRAFGSFATVLYLLGLFSGINSLIGAITRNSPPMELGSASFNIHTWPSFLVVVVFAWKTYLSYFRKGALYSKRRWLGPALFVAWAYTWLTAAVSYYLRTLPSNPQHPEPNFLLPYSWLWLQLGLPFILGGLIGLITLRKAASSQRDTARAASGSGGTDEASRDKADRAA